LVNKLKSKFDSDATLIFGNCYASHVKFQRPIRDAGLKRIVQKNDSNVLLVDEYNRSKTCPTCQAQGLQFYTTMSNTII
ncbi:hypothetical protein BDF19DRAFT_382362, partial [Syncephalis fuscata]